MFADSSSMHNRQKDVAFKRLMDKELCCMPDSYSETKNEEVIDTCNNRINVKGILLSEKSHLKRICIV